ncbi:uncharacterized protein TRAVEDRAFT_54079 [Trametes versicolor FP-101664 SS1]|uniref:Uncharacterized protein n=1 Tax=Trametes versicolor (strain FP-101664) TaxID=717944 RepID=R7S8V1_TRAVS|nr:uncharacterized protein TRAVEDRAFT_54079 [Trametes versicolor FP-101664 SS1]EIW52105.1 hypothetical protein TRAVEDRAFT_54079 [Trametes versicolor FP-101664 SS1]
METTRSQDSKHPPLWHWGFIYDLPFLFKLARKLQAEGSAGSRRAPLPDVDFSVDPLHGADLEDAEEDVMEDQTYRTVMMWNWGSQYLADYVCMSHLANYTVYVHNGRSGNDQRMVRCIAFVQADVWHYQELDGLEHTKGELPDDATMEKFTELLGPPGWYLDIQSTARDDIGPRLESGEYQVEQGMPGMFTQDT